MGANRIRAACPQDAEALLQIYAPYVEGTAITFEYAVPSAEEFENRLRATLAHYPYLTAERDGELAGYAYAGPFHARAAYAWGVETTVYVRQDLRGMGIGRDLYGALEAALSAQGILNLNACIANPETEDEYLTQGSLRFHRRLGWRLVGEFRQCGYKFNRWYNMVWMEKHIGPHVKTPSPVRPFDAVRAEIAQKYGIL